MSQPPTSPYSPPQAPQYPYGYDPYAAYSQMGDALAPARRASIMLFIVGGLLTLLGACNGISSVMLDPQQLAASNQQFMAPGQPSPFSPEGLRMFAIVCGALTFLCGIVLVGLGVPVRRGNRPAVIGALIISSLLTLLVGGFMLLALLGGIVQPMLFVAACVTLVPLVLFGLLVIWLIQALRAAGPNLQAQMQQQAAYWQYAQQQQAYQQSMYDYQQQQHQQQPPAPSSDQPPR